MISCSHISRIILTRKAPAQMAPKSSGSRLARSHSSKKSGCQPPRKTAVMTPAKTAISRNSARNIMPNFMPEYSMK